MSRRKRITSTVKGRTTSADYVLSQLLFDSAKGGLVVGGPCLEGGRP